MGFNFLATPPPEALSNKKNSRMKILIFRLNNPEALVSTKLRVNLELLFLGRRSIDGKDWECYQLRMYGPYITGITFVHHVILCLA